MTRSFRLVVRIEPIDAKSQVLTGHPASRVKQIALSDSALLEAKVCADVHRLARQAVQDVLAMNRDGYR